MEQLLPPSIVAKQLHVTPATLGAWRRAGHGPAYVKLGNSDRAKVRYRESDVQAYLAAHSVTQTAEHRQRVRGQSRPGAGAPL